MFGVFAVRVEHALAGAGWQDSTSQSVQARDVVQRDFAGLGSTALQVVVVDHNGPIASSPAAQQVVADVARHAAGEPRRLDGHAAPARASPCRATAGPRVVTAGAASDPNAMVKAADSLNGTAAAPRPSRRLGHAHR